MAHSGVRHYWENAWLCRHSPIFPHVEDFEDEDIGVGHFVANFIVSDQDSSHFTRLEFRQPNAQARVGRNSFCASDQMANDTNCGRDVNGVEKFVKANQV